MRQPTIFYITVLFTLLLFGCANEVEEVSKIPPKTPSPDIIPPNVEPVSPKKDETGINVFSVIKAQFSERMNPKSINADNIKLFLIPANEQATLVPLKPGDVGIEYNNTSLALIIRPETAFERGGIYKVELSAENENGIRDTSNNLLEINDQNCQCFTWSFIADNSTQPAVLQSFSPAQNELVSDTFAPIILNFESSSFSLADFSTPNYMRVSLEDRKSEDFCTLEFNTNKLISGNIEFSQPLAGSNTLTFTPTSPGFPLNGNINVYICLKNLSGGEFLSLAWSYSIRDGSFDQILARRILPYSFSNGEKIRISLNSTSLDVAGKLKVRWIKDTRDITTSDSITKHVVAGLYDLANRGSTVTDVLEPEIANILDNNAQLKTIRNVFSITDDSGNETIFWNYESELWATHIDSIGNLRLGAQQILTNYQISNPPIVRADKKGNIIVIGVSKVTNSNNPNANLSSLMAARYDIAANTWQAENAIVESVTQVISPLEINVIIDSSGNITAVWNQDQDYWASYYSVVTNAWQAEPTNIVSSATDGQSTLEPESNVVTDSNGNVTFIWQKQDSSIATLNTRALTSVRLNTILATRYKFESGKLNRIQTDIINNQDGTLIDNNFNTITDENGNITVIWEQAQGNYWLNHFDVASGTWQTSGASQITLREPNEDIYISMQDAVIDQRGNITFISRKDILDTKQSLTASEVYAYRFSRVAGGLTSNAPVLLNADTQTQTIQIADIVLPDGKSILDHSGNVTVIWRQGNLYWARFYDNENDLWRTPYNVFSLAGNDFITAFISDSVVDRVGNVMLFWQVGVRASTSGVSSQSLMAKRYDYNNKSWSNAYTVRNADDSNQIYLTDFKALVDRAGKISLLWTDTGDVAWWVNRFE